MALSYILVVVSALTQPVMYLRSNAAPGMTKIQSGSSIQQRFYRYILTRREMWMRMISGFVFALSSSCKWLMHTTSDTYQEPGLITHTCHPKYASMEIWMVFVGHV